jgi:hypothetical protein
MQDNWKDSGKSMNLVCTAKEVYLDQVTSAPMYCTKGQTIRVNLTASIHFNAARYDVGWYTNLQGKSAYSGVCDINGLRQEKKDLYKVTSGFKSTTIVGRVSWTEDFSGGNDACGDVLMNSNGGGGCGGGGGGGANIEVPFLEDKEILCADDK